MRICVIGTGYVGLTQGTCLADLGNNVVCIDIDQDKLRSLSQAIVPFYEPGLSELVTRNIETGRLSFSAQLADHIDGIDIVFITVGTPAQENGRVDLQYIEAVAKDIGKYMTKPLVIVTKSTVPVGTGNTIAKIIDAALFERNQLIPYEIVSNPEFLREGTALEDFRHSDRIVIGCQNKQGDAVEKLRKLYEPLKDTALVITDLASAEIIKYGANSFLAMEISFINALAQLCEQVGANIEDVAQGLKLDSRIGKKAFFQPGPGFGGSCFPKDVIEFAHVFRDKNILNPLLDGTLAINEGQKKEAFQKIKKVYPDLQQKRVAVLGIAFKPNTDDIRYAPALSLIEDLQGAGAAISVFDPEAMGNLKKIYPELDYAPTMYDCLRDADIAVIMTDWNDFKEPNWEKIVSLMRQHIIVDMRNIYMHADMKKRGFTYISVGRPYFFTIEN